MLDRLRRAVLRPTDASFFLNRKRYRAIICCVCIGISLFEWYGLFDQLFPGAAGILIAVEYLLLLALSVFFPVPTSLICLITYVVLLLSPTYAAADIVWGMLLSMFYIAFYLRRWASLGVLCLVFIAELVETKLFQDPIDSFIGAASGDIFVFCIGVLLATEERTVQAKQMEHNLQIASSLHSAITSELSSIILMARSGGTDDDTLKHIETVAQLGLDNMHSVIHMLSGGGGDNAGALRYGMGDIERYAKALDHDVHAMGFAGHLSIQPGDFSISESAFSLARLCTKECYANIARHMAKGNDEYELAISGSEQEIRITETNPSSDNPDELVSGFGLSLLEHQLEASGGTMSYGLSGKIWRIEIRIPSDC